MCVHNMQILSSVALQAVQLPHLLLTLQSNPDRARSEMPFRRKVIIISHLLRFLAPHPNITALQGASYNYGCQRAGPHTTLPRALLGIVTNEGSLPPACLDTTLTALMQLVIGFPAESNDLSSQVPPTHIDLCCMLHGKALLYSTVDSATWRHHLYAPPCYT